jgi:hypothetical protein
MHPPRYRRLRKWILGVVAAVITASLVQILTGAFTSIGPWVRGLFAGQHPLHVAMSSDFVSFAREPLVLSYVIPRPADQVPPPPAYPPGPLPYEKIEQWAASLGAVDANGTSVLITVTGRSAAAVVLTNLRVKVIERRQPLAGTHVSQPGGNDCPIRHFSVQLDSSPPTVKPLDESDEDITYFPYKVSATEPEVFAIFANADSCDCTWVAELFWTAEGRKGSTIIDDNGKPFRTTSTQNAPGYILGDGKIEPHRER